MATIEIGVADNPAADDRVVIHLDTDEDDSAKAPTHWYTYLARPGTAGCEWFVSGLAYRRATTTRGEAL